MSRPQVALKAARLACEAHPRSAAAWQLRLQQEAAAKGSKASSSSSSGAAAGSVQLLAVVKQGLQQVPTAEAEQLWLQVGVCRFESLEFARNAMFGAVFDWTREDDDARVESVTAAARLAVACPRCAAAGSARHDVAHCIESLTVSLDTKQYAGVQPLTCQIFS
jgi:hypothetical protein